MSTPTLPVFPHVDAAILFYCCAKGDAARLEPVFKPTHRLGFVDPHERSPFAGRWWSRQTRVITMADQADAVTPGVVLTLLDFGQRLRPGSRVLIHCHAGRSRSVAALLVLIAQSLPAVDYQHALRRVEDSALLMPHPGLLQAGLAGLGGPGETRTRTP